MVRIPPKNDDVVYERPPPTDDGLLRDTQPDCPEYNAVMVSGARAESQGMIQEGLQYTLTPVPSIASDKPDKLHENFTTNHNTAVPHQPRGSAVEQIDATPPHQKNVNSTNSTNSTRRPAQTPETNTEDDIPRHPPPIQQEARPSLQDRECEHTRDGVCSLHGPGAKRYWKPVRMRKREADGSITTEVKRRPYHVCDLGPRGRGRLRQSRLGFRPVRTEEGPREEMRDTRNHIQLSRLETPSVGQGGGTVQGAGINSMRDRTLEREESHD